MRESLIVLFLFCFCFCMIYSRSFGKLVQVYSGEGDIINYNYQKVLLYAIQMISM